MSVTFSAVHEVDGVWKPLWVCTDEECKGFCKECLKHNMNQSSTNARDLIEWLDLWEFSNNGDLYGSMPAQELVARCQRRLWDEPRNVDPAVQAVEEGGPGTGQCKTIFHGRDQGYLRIKTRELLFIAQCAGEHRVFWS